MDNICASALKLNYLSTSYLVNDCYKVGNYPSMAGIIPGQHIPSIDKLRDETGDGVQQ